MIARRIDPSAAIRDEEIAQAAAGRGLHARAAPRQSRQVEKRRREIDKAHEVVDHAPRGVNASRPRNRERPARAGAIGHAFRAGKRHAMIRGDHHQRVLQLAPLFEQREHAAEVAIRIFDRQRVIEHVGANHLVVGPIAGHAIDVARAPAALGDAGTVFKRSMRLL